MSVEQCQLMGSGSISASDCTVSFVSLFFYSDEDKDHDDLTKDWRLLSLSAELLSSPLALSPPLPSFWSSVSRAIVFFSRLLPFPLRRR